MRSTQAASRCNDRFIGAKRANSSKSTSVNKSIQPLIRKAFDEKMLPYEVALEAFWHLIVWPYVA